MLGEGDLGAAELWGEGSLFSERDLWSALADDTEDEEEFVCWMRDVGRAILDRELLRGDMASPSMVTDRTSCREAEKELMNGSREMI